MRSILSSRVLSDILCLSVLFADISLAAQHSIHHGRGLERRGSREAKPRTASGHRTSLRPEPKTSLFGNSHRHNSKEHTVYYYDNLRDDFENDEPEAPGDNSTKPLLTGYDWRPVHNISSDTYVYPPIEKFESAQDSMNLSGTRLFGFDKCDDTQKKVIEETFDVVKDVLRLKEVSENIDWEDSITKAFWGQNVAEPVRKAIQGRFRSLKKIVDYPWATSVGTDHGTGSLGQLLWIKVCIHVNSRPQLAEDEH